MKKLIAVFSLVLMISVSQAQQTTGTTPAANNATTVTGNGKQCKAVSKECAPGTTASEKKSKDCAAHSEGSKASANSATESMSATHVGTGSTVISTSTSDKKCKSKAGKSCCQAGSKASAINTAPQVQPANAIPEADSPK